MRTSGAIVPEGDLPLVCVWLDGQRFGIYLRTVTEVVRMMALSPLPGAPDPVVGLARVRKNIVPVIDLRRALKLEPRRYNANTPLILFETDGQLRGLVADSMDDVIFATADRIESPDAGLPYVDFLLRVVRMDDGIVLVIDHTCLLRVEDERQLEDAMHAVDEPARDVTAQPSVSGDAAP